MRSLKPQILAHKANNILSILINIIGSEGGNPLIDYPVLIGSRAAKWHVPSFREPNNWNLVATPSQSALFINKVMPNATFKDIKLIHYPDSGLKIIGDCTTDGDSINFDIELISDKFDFRNIGVNNDCYGKIHTIKFEKFNDQPKMSAQMILELCRDVKDKTFFPLSSTPCVVAPLKILEALKTSHIYWSSDFRKNIADLHSLRVLSGYNKEPTQPLSIRRDEPIELMLKTRIKETEISQGVPSAHINLNETNEEFLDREDDLFVGRHVPHDELHERVKYGHRPIYETLKDDKSKAWIKKSLFQQIDYQTQLNCVKEEAMVIALERYLIPMSSKNLETSYQLALNRICTMLTKGWFRQFAIDNYPRLSNLDKDLLSIAHDIINNHSLRPKEIHKWKLDPETQAIFNTMDLRAGITFSGDDLNLEEPADKRMTVERSGFKIINYTVIITNLMDYYDGPYVRWLSSVAIYPGNLRYYRPTKGFYDLYDRSFFDKLQLHPYDHYDDEGNSKPTSKHIFALQIKARNNGVDKDIDIWDSIEIHAKSADYIANKLGIPGLNGDLLFKYVLASLQPTLRNNGERLLKYIVDEAKVNGTIPIKPEQHLWYDIWNDTLKNSKGNRKLGRENWTLH